MNLPSDPVMLLSVINTKLRDEFSSLEDLCRSLDLDPEALCERLRKIDYEYDTQRNQFV